MADEGGAGEREKFPVKLHVYDLSQGMAKSMSMGLVGKQIDGIWHTGIYVCEIQLR